MIPRKTLTACMLIASTAAIGCGDNPVDSPLQNQTENNGADNNGSENNGLPIPGKEELENKLYDELHCRGVVSEETRNALESALADVATEDLTMSPAEIAEVVGSVALTTDTTAMLVTTVVAAARQGHVPDALAGNWDAMPCGEVRDFECRDVVTGDLTGSGSTTVSCSADQPSAVAMAFADGCRFAGLENAGSIRVERADGAMVFDGFELGSIRQIDGRLAVETSADAGYRIALAEGESPLTVATNAGKSCEERWTFARFDAIDTTDALTVDLDVERLADGKTFGVATPSGAAAWGKPASCACPEPGARLQISMSDVLGLGETGTLGLDYANPQDADSCSTVEADLVTWPESCDVGGDCGKAALESAFGKLVSTTCRTL